MEASKIFFDMINEYAAPILEAAGYHFSPQGFIEDYDGNKLFYQNPKYVDGTNDPQNPPFIYPVIPIDERSYLNIKATPEYELFNPFQNFRHACIVLIKLKKVLIPFFISKEAFEETEEDEIDEKFDDCFQVYNKRDNTGNYEVGIVCTENPNEPVEIIKYSSEELTKSVWSLCVLIYTNFCATKPWKVYKNIDRGWNKTQKLCEEWNKARMQLLQNVKVEQENRLNPDMEDLSQGINVGEDTNDFDILKDMSMKYVDIGDGTDLNNQGLQDYLTNMFPQSQLTPYEEPPVSCDESAELTVSPEVVVPNEQIPSFEIMDRVETETERAALKEKMDVEKEIEPEARRSIFKCGGGDANKPYKVQTNNMYGTMMNPMGMMIGGMPGMMGMNPMMMQRMNNLPGTNIDEMNLCSGHADPFAAYR